MNEHSFFSDYSLESTHQKQFISRITCTRLKSLLDKIKGLSCLGESCQEFFSVRCRTIVTVSLICYCLHRLLCQRKTPTNFSSYSSFAKIKCLLVQKHLWLWSRIYFCQVKDESVRDKRYHVVKIRWIMIHIIEKNNESC